MSQDESADLPFALPRDDSPDPELEELPDPRRPGRTLTLVAMTCTAVFAVLVAFTLRGQAAYALSAGPPADLGNLAELTPTPAQANTWAHGEALLGTAGAVRYGRPLEADTFRLAPVAGNDRIWVEIRVPAGLEGPRFVPPTSFVGRLVPVSEAGLKHHALPDAVASVGTGTMPSGAWLLVDGEAPDTSRWSLGVIALFFAFAAFNVWGIVRILRPVR